MADLMRRIIVTGDSGGNNTNTYNNQVTCYYRQQCHWPGAVRMAFQINLGSRRIPR